MGHLNLLVGIGCDYCFVTGKPEGFSTLQPSAVDIFYTFKSFFPMVIPRINKKPIAIIGKLMYSKYRSARWARLFLGWPRHKGTMPKEGMDQVRFVRRRQ
jgi:hypothetical protein